MGENSLEQKAAYFEEIFRHSFDGIFVADGDGRTLLVSPGCERNYDVSAETMVGRHVDEFEREGLIRPVIAGRVIADGQRVTAVQRTHAGKTIMATGVPLFDEHGAVRRVVINSRDTTEIMKLQEELAEARDSLRRIESEVQELRRQNLNVAGVVLESPEMQRIAALALRVADVDTTVLLSGESGVGKEVIAKLIHRNGPRRAGPLVKVNCGAIPHELLESELFGYEGGAFTGARRGGKIGLAETASGGTLFLDEVGELPLDLQVKLLQVLQDRSFTRVGGTASVAVDFRIVAATNVDLEARTAAGLFRSDLYYRLSVVPIHVPPLRERREDILPLAGRCLDELNERYGLDKRLSRAVLAALLRHRWPGNVRELRNVVECLVVTSRQRTVPSDDLPLSMRERAAAEPAPDADYRTRVARFEAQLVREALERHGSTRAAARHLNISQATVVRKLRAGAVG